MIYTGGTINESVLIPDIDSLVYPSNPWNPADSDKEVKILTSYVGIYY